MASKTLNEIAKVIGAEVLGAGDVVVSSVSSLEDARAGQITFLANPKYKKLMETTQASAVIVGEGVQAAGVSLLRVKDPQYAFQQAVLLLHGQRKHPHAGVHPRAFVDAGAEVDGSAVLYPGVYVGPGARIGRECVLYPNVVVYDGCIIGDRVVIHAGAVIGADGFGYAQHQGVHHKIPQVGIVKIEDDVEIGANTTIDRAALGMTLIGKGSKVDNLVMIAHNVRTGPHCLIVAQAGIAGSATLGHHVVLGGQVGVAGHVELGDGVMAGAQCGITKTVAAGEIVLGSPHMPIKETKRVLACMADLPRTVKRVRKLEQEVGRLLGEGGE